MVRRPAALRVPAIVSAVISVAVVAACAKAGSPVQQATPVSNPVVFGYELAVRPESALATARFALGTVDGAIQLPQIRPKFTTISTHYTRNRRGGGHRQVAIIIAVDREAAMRDSLPVTGMELRAFALDMAQPAPAGPRRSPFPATALSQNAPALRTPRPITPVDTVDWQALLLVAESLELKGAKRLP